MSVRQKTAVKFSAGLSNLIIHNVAERFKHIQNESAQRLPSYLRKPAVDRAWQEISLHLRVALDKQGVEVPARLHDFYEYGGQVALSSNFTIDIASGRVKFKWSLSHLVTFIRFFGRWLLALAAIGLESKREISNGAQTCLLYGIPDNFSEGDDGTSKLSKYIGNEPIPPLRDADDILVQISRKAPRSLRQQTMFCRFPETRYLKRLKLTFWRRLVLLSVHVAGLFRTLGLVIRYPLLLRFLEDFAVFWVYRKVQEWGYYPRIVLTTSDLFLQPIWARLGTENSLHCLHYAVTPQVLVESDEAFPVDAENLPHLHALAPMHHWVWFESDKTRLTEIYGQPLVSVSGVPEFIADGEPIRSAVEHGVLTILIFDVTPKLEELVYKVDSYYYGRYSTARALVMDVCDICDEIQRQSGIKVRIELKPKRKPDATHDPRYEQFLCDLEADNDAFCRISPDTQINHALSDQTLVIARPFTSVGFLTSSLDVNTIFYDPTFEIIDNCPEISRLKFVQGRLDLKQAISTHLSMGQV